MCLWLQNSERKIRSVFFQSRLKTAGDWENRVNIEKHICCRAWILQSIIRPSLLLAVLLSRCAPACAEPLSFGWEAKQWLKDSGLPDNSVTGLLQTRDKFLWVGTQAGLARFDGNDFERVTDAAGHTLKITCLYEDSSARLWVGTQNHGLLIVSNAVLVPFPSPVPFRSQNITSIAQDLRGNFWVGTSEGLMRIRGNSVTRFDHADGLPDDFVTAIHCARSGALWVTTRKGMCELRSDRFFPMEFQTQGLGPNPEFLGIYEDDKTNVWAFGDTFLVNLKDGKRLNNFRGGDAASYRIWGLCEGRNGHLWISTSGQGIFSFANGHFTPVVFRDRMLSSDVRTILEDDEGNIWLGTFGGGLIRMRQQSWQILGENAGLPNEAASCVVVGADGHVYAGFLRGGVFLGNRDRFDAVGKRFNFENQNLVTSMCVTSNSTLWISTYGDGVYQLDGDNLQHWTTANGLSDNVVLALCMDSSGAVWAGTRSGELQRFDGGMLTTFGRRNGLPGTPITCLEAVGHKIFVGTETGIVLQNDGTRFLTLPTPSKLQDKPIRALFEDSQAHLWVGADNIGLTCVAGNQSCLFDASNGFPDIDVQSIIGDLKGNIWVGTTKGIWLIRKDNFSKRLPTALNSQSVFAETAGLPGPNLPGGPGAAVTPDGTLFFASSHGIIEVNPRESLPSHQDLKVILVQVLLNNAVLSPSAPDAAGRRNAEAGMVQVRSEIHSLEFRFTAVDLSSPAKLHFQHFLEGFDSDWVDNGNERTVHYGRLPFGKYRFRVRVSNGDNAWHEMAAPFEFQLKPPLWRSGGALTLFGVAALGLVTFSVRQVYHRRLRRKLAQLAQQQALEKERMRIAQNMHDEIGSKLTRVCFLSELVLSGKESTGENLRSIATTSHKLLQNLDEIVWAVNPQNDTIESLAAYLCQYATEYFQGANIAVDLKIPGDLPHVPLSSEIRHNLFLAFEEAISNALKHSQATQISIEIFCKPAQFTIVVRDNGRGFASRGKTGGPAENPAGGSKRIGNGLKNMKGRLEAMGGECLIESVPGQGTTVGLRLPLPTQNHHD
jgi:ligand-binding sensor domain-containing protein/signal transduction histidine kinase